MSTLFADRHLSSACEIRACPHGYPSLRAPLVTRPLAVTRDGRVPGYPLKGVAKDTGKRFIRLS
jgi:hypothetical protein